MGYTGWHAGVRVCLVLTSAAAAPALTAPALAQGGPPQFAAAPPGVALTPAARAPGAGIEVADVNGDNRADIVIADIAAGVPVITTLLNLSDDVFSSPITTTPQLDGADFGEIALALADFNGDRRADLVTTRLARFSPESGVRPNLAILFGQENGGFAGQVNLVNSWTDTTPRGPGGRSVAIADMNGDLRADIVSPAGDHAFSVLRGNGNGTFMPPLQSGWGSGVGAGGITLLADVTGDAVPDVVSLVNTGSDAHAQTTVAVNLNDGSGAVHFQTAFTLDVRLTNVRTGQARAYLTDLNGDARADLVVFGERGDVSGEGGLYVLLAGDNGEFTLTARETRAEDNESTATIAVAGFTGGRAHILKVPNASAFGQVWVNDGMGGYANRAGIGFDTMGRVLAGVGDIGHNRLPDLVTTEVHGGTPRARWRLNLSLLLHLPGCGTSDFNGDGDFGTDQDIEAFFACIGGFCCTTCCPCGSDFNGDGDYATDQDIEAFFRILGGGPC
ncbi:MAG TPA: VCBS repeat-containing protein [Phycisphaerales bacterium]|nr:VCBS repeat-containing protein [Phycisphaerales bacterium]